MKCTFNVFHLMKFGYYSTGTRSNVNFNVRTISVAKLIILCLIIFFSSSVSADDIFIQDGSSASDPDGSEESPFETIQAAVTYVSSLTPIPTDVIFQIKTGTYNERVTLQITLPLTSVERWTFRAFNGVVTISDDAGAAPLFQVCNMMGADLIFENIGFHSPSIADSKGFYTTSPTSIGTLKFVGCSFSNLNKSVYITESPVGTDLTIINNFEVVDCSFNDIKNQGMGILTSCANINYTGDQFRFIWNINIHDNVFQTEGIVDPQTDYTFDGILIRNWRKLAAAYDSLAVFNNTFINDNPNIKPNAIRLDRINWFAVEYECDRVLKAWIFENEIKNYRIISNYSKLQFYDNKAHLPNLIGQTFISFHSQDTYRDTLWAERNYIKAYNAYYLSDSMLIDYQNSIFGVTLEGSKFFTGENSSAEITNSLISGFGTNFELTPLNCGILTQYCFYDNMQNNAQVAYGDSIVIGDPLILPDDDNMTYSLKWNQIEESPCIMAGNDLRPIQNGVSGYDRLDIGCVQYDGLPHSWTHYGFPPHNVNNGIKWISFPALNRLRTNPNDQYWAYDIFSSLQNSEVMDNCKFKFPGENLDIIYTDGTQFIGTNHKIEPRYGYKFTMSSQLQSSVGFWVGGLKPDVSETPIELFAYQNNKLSEHYENWIGYFVDKTQTPQAAFGPFIDNLFYIQTQKWTMIRDNNGQWISASGQNNGYPLTLSYGDMVAVKCYQNVPAMHWFSGGVEYEPYEKEDLEHYQYEEKTEYIPVFIDFEGTDLPKEIGLYIDNICKGGAKIIGTLVEVPAYILDDLPDFPEIEFRMYYDNKTNDIVPEYTLMNPETGSYTNDRLQIFEKKDYFRIKINTDVNNNSLTPKVYLDNYPNPFNPTTMIEYYLPENAQVTVDIYNIKGQIVATIVSGYKLKGMNQVCWDGEDSQGNAICSGVYFASLDYKGAKSTKKMLLLK